MKKGKITIIAICLVMSASLFLVMTITQKQMLLNYEKGYVVVAAKNLTAGTEITEKNMMDYFRVEEVPMPVIISDTYSNIAQLTDKYTRETISAGEIIYSKNIINENKHLSQFKKPVEITLNVKTATNGVAGTLRKGDRINVYVKKTDVSTSEVSYKPILQNVYVNNVYDDKAKEIEINDKTTPAIIILFYVEEGEVEQILKDTSEGDLVFVRLEN